MATFTINVLSKAHSELLKNIKDYKDAEEWAVTNKRFVAFLDILGFKELVLRSTHEEIYNKLSEISNLKDDISPKILDSSFSNENTKPIEIITFSDSIIIFSKNDSLESFKVFIEALNWVFSRIIENKIAIKGAFAHGEISVDIKKQIYFGQALIDAYLLQEDVDYLGVVAHHSIDNFISLNKLSDLSDLLIEMPTPLKSGKITQNNLNYFPFIVYKDAEKMLDHFAAFKLTMSGRPKKYLENSINFYHEYLKLLK
ncbi:hypothetical protein [uncultured Chryseobacterium sp.]|uniref:hypothetical protein n=1 Tax=uncultured Chryseobacterium sp. TaxID=259322 RepID=UPI0025F719B2|nr:hypothetical protein [uncultured Chryseobacterium sp.]